MFWIGIVLFLGITSAQYDEYDTYKYDKGVWGLSGFDCNQNWKAHNSERHNVKDCERYSKEGWCTKDGDYGPNWNHGWGNFDKWAAKSCTWWECRKGKPPTALSCPQCGCRIVAKDAPDDKKIKYKKFEVAGKTYVRVESFRWEYRWHNALDWYTARERCQRLGFKHGDLASFPTYEEFEEVTREMRMEDSRCKSSWIGLKMDRSAEDTNDWQWRWLTGETVKSTDDRWASGRPKEGWLRKWRGEQMVGDPCVMVEEATPNEPAKIIEYYCSQQYPKICSYLCQVSDTADAINADNHAAADNHDD